MTRLIETATGAQILPPVQDPKRLTSALEAAYASSDADLRHTSSTHLAIAKRLHIERDNNE